MKKILFSISILSCMLLAGCQKNAASEPDQIQDELQESVQEEVQEDLQESTIKVKSDAELQEIVLYEDHGIQIMLKAAMAIHDYGKTYVVTAANTSEEVLDVQLDNWLINDTYVLPVNYYFYSLEPGSEDEKEIQELTAVTFYEDVNVDSIQLDVQITNEDYDIIDEQSVVVECEGGLAPGLLFAAAFGARADEQILLENDDVTVTLLGWGKSPEDGHYVQGLLHVENHSRQTIPVMIDGLSINGFFLDVADSVNFLMPEESCYVEFYHLMSDYEDAGITSITEVGIMLMTDESENTGDITYGGGSWYPVVLSEQSTEVSQFETGEIIEQTDDIEISLISYEMKEYLLGGGIYKWKLAVVNNSDENIELALTDLQVDGLSLDKWEEGDSDKSVFLSEGEVGAHAQRYAYINVTYDEEKIDAPDLSFIIQIRSMAGGSVIYTGKEKVNLNWEE